MIDKEYKFITDSTQSQILGNEATITGFAMLEGDDTEGGGFTKNAMAEFLEQVKTKKIEVDSEHLKGFDHNIKMYLDKIMKKEGINPEDISFELNKILEFSRLGTLPIAKIFDAKEVNGKIELVTKTNKAFSTVDDAHNKYYNSFMESLKNKFVDGYSVTFIPKRYKFENGKQKIDSLIVKGVALTGGASHPNTRLTAVAYRCANDYKPVYGKKQEVKVRMATEDGITTEQLNALIEQNKKLTEQSEALLKADADRKKSEADAKLKAEADAKAKEEADLKTQLEKITKEKEALERQAVIANAQLTTNAGSKRIANPDKDKIINDDPSLAGKIDTTKVSGIIKSLDDSTKPREKQKIMRKGDIITNDRDHDVSLAKAVCLQSAGKTNNLRELHGVNLNVSKADLIIPKE